MLDDHNFFPEIEFLYDYKWIFRSTNVRILDQFHNFPLDWIEDLDKLSIEELNDLPNLERWPKADWCESLKTFFTRLKSVAPKQLVPDFDCTMESKLPKKISPKKFHEIRQLSELIYEICDDKIENLIDFGSGLGYLSEYLSNHYQFNIIGLEGCESNVVTCYKREPTTNIKYINHFITNDSKSFIEQCSSQSFDSNSFAIIGLHACADLSITAIRLFFDLDNAEKLIIMPCCYHRMKETGSGEIENFPLSSNLKTALDTFDENREIFKKPFLRLACQESACRWKEMTEADHKNHSRNMFERALAECVLEKGQKVKRNNLVDGISGREIAWSEKQKIRIEELNNKYPNGSRIAEYFTALQNVIQGLCENLVIIDRLLFIKELSMAHKIDLKTIEARKICDDKQSPRCYALIAEKSVS